VTVGVVAPCGKDLIEFERDTMRHIIIAACVGIILAGNMSVLAQNVVAPPDFVPGGVDVSTSSPERIVPPEPRVFSGSGAASDVFDGSVSPGDPLSERVHPRRLRRGNPITSISPPPLISAAEPPLPRVWFRPEALLWWSKSSPLPAPIVTVGSLNDQIPGAIGQPGTSVLLGNQNIGLPTRGGGRFTFGFSFDAEQSWGIEATYFYLSNPTVTQGVYSDGGQGSALLAFPYYDPLKGGESASPIAYPGSFAGNAVLTLQSLLQGTDVDFLHNVHYSNKVRVDLLGGFRYVNFQENLNFSTDSPNVSPNPPAFFQTYDQFNVANNFYGGQLGVRASYDVARFFFNTTGKLALGSTFETVSVDGGTATNAGGYATAPGSYLSQPSNLGTTTRNQFAVVPEMNLNVGFRLRPWASIIVGYSFLYISSVARPGEQVSHVVNPTQSSAISNYFPANPSGPALPGLHVHNTDFWAQGLNFAFELRF
jgi:Putative beta barrel porin-7 (BBP7)